MSYQRHVLLMDSRRRAATITGLELLARTTSDPSGAIDALEAIDPSLAAGAVAALAARAGCSIAAMRAELAALRRASIAELESALAAPVPELASAHADEDGAGDRDAQPSSSSPGDADLEPRV